jgi:hypothetical protein
MFDAVEWLPLSASLKLRPWMTRRSLIQAAPRSAVRIVCVGDWGLLVKMAGSAISPSRAFLHHDQTLRLVSVTRQSKNESLVHFVCKPLTRLKKRHLHERLRAPSLSTLPNPVMLREHAECSNQNALRAFLSHRSTTPAATRRPLAD